MRNLIFLIAFFSALPLSLRRPLWGVLFYYWISLMNPHRYAWGSLQDMLPFAKIAAGLSFISALIHFREIRMVHRIETYAMLIFIIILIISSQIAYYPQVAQDNLKEVMKVFVMAFMAIIVLNHPKYLLQFLAAIIFFVGFIGLKGAIFSIATGGAYRIYGPEYSSLADNNDVGLAMVMIIPLCFGMSKAVSRKSLKYIFQMVGFASVVSGIFTYSRGAFVGLFVVGLSYLIFSKHRLVLSILFPSLLIAGYQILPQKYKDRILTIKTYDMDRSALQRLNSWGFSLNLASNNMLGGGFGCFTPELYYIYAPDPSLGIYRNKEGKLTAFTAHSIYFQTLAEHGVVGLLAFLLCLISVLLSMFKITILTNRLQKAQWMNSISRSMIISVLGYMAAGAFLSRAYFEVFWALYAAAVAMKDLLYRGEIELKESKKERLGRLFVDIKKSQTSVNWQPHVYLSRAMDGR